MKNSFKYIFLILMVSFIIATLCCKGNETLEEYSAYPFEESATNAFKIDVLQDALFKYNNVVENTKKAGAIDYNSKLIIQEIKEDAEQSKKKREKVIYSQLKNNNLQGTYVSYENILPELFQRVPSEVKGDEIVIEMEANVSNKVGDGGLGAIKERSKEGDFYYDDNACQGNWTEWINNSCGGTTSRCGIKFKKYEIVKPEVNDEKGFGKPCDYKDGDIKYRYCDGDGLYDYQSNNDRCGTAINSCTCKLDEDSVMVVEGENVYDLEDSDCQFQKETDCVCPPGFSITSYPDICKLTPGVDCSIKEPGCIYTPTTGTGGESCKKPTFINEAAEKAFYEKYSSFDGKCKENKCICPNGIPIEGERCFADGAELCDLEKPCEKGYFYEGSPPTCKQQSTTNNQCSCFHGSSKVETSERCKQSALDTAGHDIRQYCDQSGCSDGYEHKITNCNSFYPPNAGDTTTIIDNIYCCAPKYDTCILHESQLEEQNIKRRSLSSAYVKYSDMKLSDLRDEYQKIQGDFDIALGEDNPKLFIIQELMENEGDEDAQCRGDITVDKCGGEFRCKSGYSFLPDPAHSSETELRMVSCVTRGDPPINVCYPKERCKEEGQNNCKYSSNLSDSDIDKLCRIPDMTGVTPDCPDTDCFYRQMEKYYPTWNGTCVPVSCPVSSDIKEIYDITSDSCFSNSENCGKSNITCKKDDYSISKIDKMLYCRSPSVVASDYLTKDYELIHVGCSKTGVEVSAAEKARRERVAEMNAQASSTVGGGGTAADAAARTAASGIDASNIGTTVADSTEPTSQQELELATEIEETIQTGERQLDTERQEERNRDIAARAEAAGIQTR